MTYTRNDMLEVLTALWDMQTSPDCWCDAGEGAPMHSPACAYARDVARKYKALASSSSVPVSPKEEPPSYGNAACMCGHTSNQHGLERRDGHDGCFECGCEAYAADRSRLPSLPLARGAEEKAVCWCDRLKASGSTAPCEPCQIATLRAKLARVTAAEAALRTTLREICIRIEKPSAAETHRELSADRRQKLDAVYALAESALASATDLDALAGDQTP